ncbi:hypothetical protein [Pontibacter silvestris]|nr:hypothetical protein [Pontibacter silvestris]MCC9138548.1 hypothetical protein [Pontibacter silvestris]
MATRHNKEIIIYHQEPDYEQPSLLKILDNDKLSYGLYANENEPEKINILPDFSYAGYMGGGVALPNVPVKVTLSPMPGNNKKQIQDAIDAVSNMPVDSNGFKGKVLLKAGIYNIDGALRIKSSGVVIAGEGQGANGTILNATREAKHTLIILGEGANKTLVNEKTESPIISGYVPTGSISFTVKSTSGYKIGDTIIIQKSPNENWITGLNMGQYGWTPELYRIPHERVITAVKGNQLTVNIPVVDPIKLKDGGAFVYKANSNRKTQQSGVENLRLISRYKNDEDEEHGWCGVKLIMAENCWVKKVSVLYFGFSAVIVDKNSAFNTIEDCAMLDPKAKTEGMRKYSFNIQSGSFNLFQRCYARGGRHDYVTGPKVTGPNVFLDCYATKAKSDIGPHHRWATGTLFDNVQGQQIRVINRKSMGSGHGWAGAQTMFWNCTSTSGKGMAVESPPGNINWVVGGEARQLSGTGYQELLGQQVEPRSLYLAQLQSRLGQGALKNITSATQRVDVIYPDLARWAGEK